MEGKVNAVYCNGRGMAAGVQAAGHIVSAVSKQREMNPGAQLAFSMPPPFSFHLRPQP